MHSLIKFEKSVALVLLLSSLSLALNALAPTAHSHPHPSRTTLYHDFVIVIPSYNNQRWCQANIYSALNQDYPAQHFRIIFVNDCSTDQTSALVRTTLSLYPKHRQVTVIDNPERRGALQNFYDIITNRCRPDEIIVTLDGDDQLKDTAVLSYLNQVYADANIWLTYGSYDFWPSRPNLIAGAAAYPKGVVAAGTFRQHGFSATHLRTFYAGLFHKIKLTDLQDQTGQFWQVCPDLAIMFPLLEMAGERAHFIAKILYRYNTINPLAENQVRLAQTRQFGVEFDQKAPYQRLAVRDW